MSIKFSMNITTIYNQYKTEKYCFSCGDSEDRTHDLLLAKQALSQLSYIPNTQEIYITGGPMWSCTTDLTLIRGAL